MNDLIRDNLKEIVKSVFLNWKSLIMSKNLEQFIILVNITYLLFFFRDIHKEYLSMEVGDDEQSNFAAKIKNLDKGKKQLN